MADACTRSYSGVIDRSLSHDGDPGSPGSSVPPWSKESPEGAYISKGGRQSLRKVELAVAVMAFDSLPKVREPLIAWR
jgi:hypothetical protein